MAYGCCLVFVFYFEMVKTWGVLVCKLITNPVLDYVDRGVCIELLPVLFD